jgi:hypothetical protein
MYYVFVCTYMYIYYYVMVGKLSCEIINLIVAILHTGFLAVDDTLKIFNRFPAMSCESIKYSQE